MKIDITKTNIKTIINENFMGKFHKTDCKERAVRVVEENIRSSEGRVTELSRENSGKEVSRKIKEEGIDKKVSLMARDKLLSFMRAEISKEVEDYSKEKTKEEIERWSNRKIKIFEKQGSKIK